MSIGALGLLILIGLLVGGGLIVLVVFAFAKGNSAVRWLLAGLLLVPLAAILLLFSFRAVRMPVARPAEMTQVAEIVPIDLSVSPVWSEALEEELIPDKYSSAKAAAYGLGMQLKETITETGIPEPNEIIISEQSSLTTELLNELRRGLKSQYENADIYFKAVKPSDLQEGQIAVSVNKEEQNSPPLTITWSNGRSNSSQTFQAGSVNGSLEAKVITAKGNYLKTVSYDHRSWLWDLNQFQSHISGPFQWQVAVSQDTATDPAQVRSQSLDQAVVQLNQAFNIPRHGQITRQDLLHHGFIVDEYTQKFQGLSGPIYRHAILLDVQPTRMIQLTDQIVNEQKVQRTTWAKTIFSLLGMILLVSVIYIFVNAATKGYYSTILAVLAVAALIIGGMVLMMFIA